MRPDVRISGTESIESRLVLIQAEGFFWDLSIDGRKAEPRPKNCRKLVILGHHFWINAIGLARNYDAHEPR
jgi:hypothetical protein